MQHCVIGVIVAQSCLHMSIQSCQAAAHVVRVRTPVRYNICHHSCLHSSMLHHDWLPYPLQQEGVHPHALIWQLVLACQQQPLDHTLNNM